MGVQPYYYLARNVRETRRENPEMDNPAEYATSVIRHRTDNTTQKIKYINNTDHTKTCRG